MINLIFLIYWLLIFEGVLRKWGVPEYKDVIFFIRVPFVLVVYALAFHLRRWPKATHILQVSYVLAIFIAMLAVIQFFSGEYDYRYSLLIVQGWMNYFFYIPLAFIIAEQFGKEEINSLIRQTLWFAIAAAPLVIMQYNVPSTDMINQGFGIDEEHQFQNLGSGLGLVRPFGFFTSTLGQQMFVASCMAILAATWLMPKNIRPVKSPLLVVSTLAILILLILSQSRGLFFNAALVLLFAVMAIWIRGDLRTLLKIVLFLTLLIPVTLALWMMVFPTAFEAFDLRVMGAAAEETQYFEFGVVGRAFYGFYSFLYYLQDTPVIGYLLGFGSNAARQLPWVVLPNAAYLMTGPDGWAEEGWDRHIVELGPLFGIIYILFRIGLTWWLLRLALQAIRRANNFTPILFFSFVGITLLNGQITGHGTVNGYTWLFVGFCAASARDYSGRRIRHKTG